MPLTVGTAGHIDHGKTRLVGALTGQGHRPPARGAGARHLHRPRLRAARAAGRAAPLRRGRARPRALRPHDGRGRDRHRPLPARGRRGRGRRPQTHEHLAILRLLGIEHGVVAVTKVDAVDEESRELALMEARELAPGAAVVATSARTGEGLDELRAALAAAAAASSRAPRRGPRGSSSTASSRCTGSGRWSPARSGRARSARAIRCGPSRRGSTCACGASRCTTGRWSAPRRGSASRSRSPGSSGADLRRGDALVEPGAYPLSYRLDVALEPLAEIADGARVHVHHGTAEHLARVVGIDERHAQLRLAAPAVAARGDRVVLREGTTLGGGVVLDPARRGGLPPSASSSWSAAIRRRSSWRRCRPRASRSGAGTWRAGRCSRPTSWTPASPPPCARATGT